MFLLTDKKIDSPSLLEAVANDRAGALITFEGRVRNHSQGRQVLLLEYEAYEGLAASEAVLIIQEARERFDVIAIAAAHRTGRLEIGDTAVWIGVCAAHRQEAYLASRYVIDEIKMRLPIWKKETYTDGSSGWVNCRCDHQEEGEAGRRLRAAGRQ